MHEAIPMRGLARAMFHQSLSSIEGNARLAPASGETAEKK